MLAYFSKKEEICWKRNILSPVYYKAIVDYGSSSDTEAFLSQSSTKPPFYVPANPNNVLKGPYH